MAKTTENPEADVRDHIKWSFMVCNFDDLSLAVYLPTFHAPKPKCGCNCDICTVIFDRMLILIRR